MMSTVIDTRSGGLRRRICGSKDHNWLVETSREHLFGSEDD